MMHWRWQSICREIEKGRRQDALEIVKEALAELNGDAYVDVFPFFKDMEEAIAVLKVLESGLLS